MPKLVHITFNWLLIVLLSTCWVVGEAWHLVPGMAHLEKYPAGYLVVGATCTPTQAPVDCDQGIARQQSPCPLKVLSFGQCPICRVLSQQQAICATQALKPSPELVHARPIDRAKFHISSTASTADARAPPI